MEATWEETGFDGPARFWSQFWLAVACKLLESQINPQECQNSVEIMSNPTAPRQINVEFMSNRPEYQARPPPGSLKPSQIQQIKGQTDPKTRHSSLARKYNLSFQ